MRADDPFLAGGLEVETSRRGTVLRAILPISTMKDRRFPWREAAE